MNGLQIQDKEEEFHVDKASKWTIYFLIDLKVLFIITYVYITIVHLISTTANSEANSDIDSMALFTVSSQPNHSDVIVSYIDDAVLWNCRRYSVTRKYYKGLYAMLLSAFSATMIALFVTKLTILCGNKTGISHLWKIAVVQHLQASDGDHCTCGSSCNQLAKAYGNLLKTDVFKKSDIFNNKVSSYTTKEEKGSQMKRINNVRMANLLISVLLLPVSVFLSFITYDLHPLSCIFEPNEESINYASSTRTVEIRYSDRLLLFQKLTVFFIALIAVILLLNALCFYLSNSIIVDHLKTYVKAKSDEILKEVKQTDEKDKSQLQGPKLPPKSNHAS